MLCSTVDSRFTVSLFTVDLDLPGIIPFPRNFGQIFKSQININWNASRAFKMIIMNQ